MKSIRRKTTSFERFAEHDRLVGWKNYSSPLAAFNSKVQPKFELTLREQNKKASTHVEVYFKHFTSIVVPTYSFLKIGITRHSGRRFSFDSEKFQIKTLVTIDCKDRVEALKNEQELLVEFSQYLKPPVIRLMSGGHSECLVYDKELIPRVIEAFEKRGGTSRIWKKVYTHSLNENIKGLLALIDFSSIKKENASDYTEMQLRQILGLFRNSLKKLGIKNLPSRPELFEYCYEKLLKR